MRARSLPVLRPPCWPQIVSALPHFSIPWISSWYIVYSLDWGVWKIVWRHDFLSCCHLTWAVERVLLEFPRRHRRWRGVWFAYEPLAGDHEMSCIRCSPILFSPLRLESPECIDFLNWNNGVNSSFSTNRLSIELWMAGTWGPLIWTVSVNHRLSGHLQMKSRCPSSKCRLDEWNR